MLSLSISRKTGEITTSTSFGDITIDVLTLGLRGGPYNPHRAATLNTVSEKEPVTTLGDGTMKYHWTAFSEGQRINVTMELKEDRSDHTKFSITTSINQVRGKEEPQAVAIDDYENNKLVSAAITGLTIKRANHSQTGKLALEVADKINAAGSTSDVVYVKGDTRGQLFGYRFKDTGSNNEIIVTAQPYFFDQFVLLNGVKIDYQSALEIRKKFGFITEEDTKSAAAA